MFGYATNETEEYMPYPIMLAHKLVRRLTEVRKNGTLKYLRPDGKSQVTVEYGEDGKPLRLDAVVLSTQHDENVTQGQIHEDIKKYVFEEVLPKHMVDEENKIFHQSDGTFCHRRTARRQRTDRTQDYRRYLRADMRVTAAVHFLARTVRKLTVLRHMPQDMWLRILWLQVWQINVRFSSLMPSALRSRHQSAWILSAQESFQIQSLLKLSEKILISDLPASLRCLT